MDAARDGAVAAKAALTGLGQDASFALRSASRRPLHAVVVVGTLAVAIGGNAAIYSVAHAALFETLPYAEGDRIMSVEGSRQGLLDYTGAGAWRPSETLRELPGVDAATVYIPEAGANLVNGGGALRLRLTHVSDDFFRVMGIEPLRGTGFGDAPDDRAAVIVSHGLWTRAFGSDPELVGRSIGLNGRTFTVIGVAPVGVDFPAGTDLWLPLPPVAEFYGGAYAPRLAVRLAPGAERAATEELLQARTEEARARLPTRVGPVPAPALRPLREHLSGPMELPLLLLGASAGLVLLLGCLNLSGIFIATLSERSGELSARIALGGSRPRVVRQLLVEVLLLAGLGGLLGVALAAVTKDVLVAWLPTDAMPGMTASLSPEVVALSMGVTLLAGLSIGLPPAVRAVGRVDGRPTDRGLSRDRDAVRFQGGLAVAQISLAMVLLVGAGLTARSLAGLHDVPLGFDTEGVLTFRVSLPEATYGDRAARNEYIRRVRSRLQDLPGVEAVGATVQLPMAEGMGVGYRVRRAEPPMGEPVPARWLHASPDYFRALGTRILEGRTFSEDEGGERRPIVIDEVLARTLFPSGGAVGARLAVDSGSEDDPPATVIGVVEHLEMNGPRGYPQGIVVEPLSTLSFGALGFAIRTRGSAGAVAPLVDEALADVDPLVPAFDVRTVGQRVSRVIAANRTVAVVSGLFAGVAALLASLGLYGLLARGVSRRRKELGVRMALGADGRRVMAMILSSGGRLAGAGVLLGLPVAVGLSGTVDELLFDVEPRDPGVIGLSVALVLGVTFCATVVPAIRAVSVRPGEVLTEE